MRLLPALLLLAAAELVLVAALADWFGAGWVTAALIALSVLGFFVMRSASRATGARLRELTVAPESLNPADADLALRWLAGLLLLIPGFISGAVGLVLLLPPVQRRARGRVGRRITNRFGPFAGNVTIIQGEVVRNEPPPPPSPPGPPQPPRALPPA